MLLQLFMLCSVLVIKKDLEQKYGGARHCRANAERLTMHVTSDGVDPGARSCISGPERTAPPSGISRMR